MTHELTPTERAEMTRLLGDKRAGVILAAADRMPRAPKGELTGRRDPNVMSGTKAYTQVIDPRTGALTRLTIDILERIALDPQIGIALEFIKLPILAMKPEVIHPDKVIKEFLQNQIERQWFKLSRDMLLALEYGFIVSEKIYGYKDLMIERKGEVIFSGRAVVYEFIKSIHPRGVELNIGPRGEDLGFKQVQGADSGQPTVEPAKALRYTYDERFGNPYGNARTRRAYKPWWWSDLIYQFANRYFEDQSIPQRKVFFEPAPVIDDAGNITDPSKTAALQVAEDSRSGAAVAFPLQTETSADGTTKYTRGWDMELMTGQDKATEFVEYLNHLDLKKMRGMFVPEKLGASAEGGGAYNMLEILAEMFMQSEEAIAVDILDSVAKQWARPLIDYNFGSSQPDAMFVQPKLSKDNQTLIKDLFVSTMEKVVAPNAESVPRIDLTAMAEGLGVPILQDDGVTDEGESETPPPAPEPAQLSQRERITLSTRPYRGNWEKATTDFETELEAAYLDWTATAARKLDNAKPEERETILDELMAVLLAALLALHRKRIIEAYSLGYQDDLSAQAMQDAARRMQDIEKKLEAELIPKLRGKFAQDASDPSTDTKKSLESRSKYVTASGGSAFWGTVFAGLSVALINREQATGEKVRVRWQLDPLVQKHCDDCLNLAGEYESIASLPTYPGYGATECGDYCRCYLQISDGRGGWSRLV